MHMNCSALTETELQKRFGLDALKTTNQSELTETPKHRHLAEEAKIDSESWPKPKKLLRSRKLDETEAHVPFTIARTKPIQQHLTSLPLEDSQATSSKSKV